MKLNFNYSKLSIDDSGVKSLVRTFKKKGTEVVSVDVPGSEKRSSGVKYKEVYLGFADSQQVGFRLSEKGAVFQALLNGRVTPIKNQDDHEKAVVEMIDAMDAGRKAFVKRLQARLIDAPEKAKTSTIAMRAELMAKRDGLRESVLALRAELEELRQEATSDSQTDIEGSANKKKDVNGAGVQAIYDLGAKAASEGKERRAAKDDDFNSAVEDYPSTDYPMLIQTWTDGYDDYASKNQSKLEQRKNAFVALGKTAGLLGKSRLPMFDREFTLRLNDLSEDEQEQAKELWLSGFDEEDSKKEDPTSPDTYAKVMSNPEMQKQYQDRLDNFFQQRMVDIRNAMRDANWSIGNSTLFGVKSKGDGEFFEAKMEPKFVRSNIVGLSIKVDGVEIVDDLTKTPQQIVDDMNQLTGDGFEEAETVVITGKELGEFPDTEEGKKALSLKAIEHFRGVLEKGEGVFNTRLKKWIKFNGTARDKVSQFSKDPRKLLVVSKLDAIVADGKPTALSPLEPHDKAKRKGVVKTHVMKTNVNIKGQALKIRFLVHEMKNGNFFYDHSVDKGEASEVLGGNAAARNSADAADLNNSALLRDEPSSQQHLTRDNLTNALDSVNGRMVLNLFIEGEEPEYIDDSEDDRESPEEDASQEVAVKDLNQQINDDNASIDDKDFHVPNIGNDVIVTKVSENQWTVSLADEDEKVEIWNDKQAGRYQASTNGSGHGYGGNLAQAVVWAEKWLREKSNTQPAKQQEGDDLELDPSKLKPMPEIAAEAEQSANEFIEDEAFLKSVIAGNEDFSSDDFAEKLIAVGEKHENSPSEAMQALVEQAAQVYSGWVISESRKVL